MKNDFEQADNQEDFMISITKNTTGETMELKLRGGWIQRRLRSLKPR
jgi:hypothetical protein